MDPNTPQPSATPLPESVANALMSINPRYNSFHQHNAIPSMPGNSYNQDSGHGSSAAANGNGSNNGNTSVQPATTSVINLSNSSDVVIGPMTQYQGAVTIYQYMDATVEATRIACEYVTRCCGQSRTNPFLGGVTSMGQVTIDQLASTTMSTRPESADHRPRWIFLVLWDC